MDGFYAVFGIVHVLRSLPQYPGYLSAKVLKDILSTDRTDDLTGVSPQILGAGQVQGRIMPIMTEQMCLRRVRALPLGRRWRRRRALRRR